MFGLTVRFEVRPDTADAFDALVAETVPLIAAHEPGTLIYTTHRVAGDDNARLFYELYRDREAFEDHENQPHIHHFVAERQDLLTGPPRIECITLTSGTGLPTMTGA
ncbi:MULTISPECIES: putative quinol monooxygenase [unclassified Frankia]